jgi:predicted metalloprotease with PDZ domain
MKIRLSLLVAALCLSMTASARELHYTVNLRHPETHKLHVTLEPVGFRVAPAQFQMPIWAPGAYSVSHYGHYVQNFKAFDKTGAELAATADSNDHWTIAEGRKVAKIEYDVLDSHSDSTSLYFAMANMDTSLFFANATALFGYYDNDKKASATVHYEKPAGWKFVCALPPSKNGYVQDTNATFQNTDFYAKDYDELADAPIMSAPADGPPSMVTRSFKVGSAVYDLAIASDMQISAQKMDSVVEYLRKIVHAETDFFHDTPYDHYTFVVYSPSLRHTPSFAQGALEHMNSSDYMFSNYAWPMMRRQFIPIYSHEFFHLWNVKRIHSALLGPFDYTERVKTTSLWLSEGVTEYYAHTLLTRYGILPPSSFYDEIAQWRAVMNMMPDSSASKKKSLEEMSIDESDFHFDEATMFYIKGPLVALALDLEIRSKTNDKYSLDSVMLALNALAKKKKFFKDEDLIKVVNKLAHADLTEFYAHYIKGTDSLPLDHYLGMMGVSRKPKDGEDTPASEVTDESKRVEGQFIVDLKAPPLAQQMRKEIVGD